jgi:hypothetical protein
MSIPKISTLLTLLNSPAILLSRLVKFSYEYSIDLQTLYVNFARTFFSPDFESLV